MKEYIQNLLTGIVSSLKNENILSADTQIRIMVENTKDKAHGDFASNIAMMLARPMKKNPREIAELLISRIPANDKISRVEIAGPGFINFFANKAFIENQVNDMLKDPLLGVRPLRTPETVVIDYSSPNVAKEMAVHHIRSTVIGDAVVRILEFLGNRVIRANHIGDWGTQFGMLIACLEKKEEEHASSLELSDLEAFYREAKKYYDEDPQFAEKARKYVVKLQSGDEYCREMWQKLVKITMDQNQEIYRRLNISLTEKDVMGESLYNPMLKPLVDDLISRNLAKEDQGAIVVYLDNFKDKDGNPRGVIVRKSDGGFLYTTTDIACTKYRVEHFGANRIIVFADSRQHEHLLMAWDIAKMAGYLPENVLTEHGSFGMMLGKDGKPFKTRSGGTVKLKEFLDEAENRAATLMSDRNNNLSPEEKSKVIHTVAMGAVKYADLSKNRTTDYIFDWDNMLTFDGNTAPYLQYAYSRVQSIFRKTDAIPGKISISAPEEEDLLLKFTKFNEVVNSAAEKAMPHLLCTYLYELAGLFMKFYESCPITKQEVPDNIKTSRLAISECTAKILKTGLGLLGIETLERM
ncbi:arginine--tRNA ligase [Succinimonas amylolytica]|uniref:arginine--tRNA ligase n=1 Tax=Succinimonas amylolytica TaxID=83769 RepID=UPI00036DFAE8|nr:arginine--tRNA ligase [Succinimonas amylolytica]